MLFGFKMSFYFRMGKWGGGGGMGGSKMVIYTAISVQIA